MKKFAAAFLLWLGLAFAVQATISIVHVNSNADTSKTFYGYLGAPDQGLLLSVNIYKFNAAEEPGFQWETYQSDVIEPQGNTYFWWVSDPLASGSYYISIASITSSHVEYSFVVP